MPRWPALVAALLAAILVAGSATAGASPFADWAAVVVAGDFHAAHTDDPTETFDNARRDVAAELIRKGFSAANLRQFSVRPQLYPDARPGKADLQSIHQGLRALTQTARGCCLLYFTSHGAPQGLVLGGALLAPPVLDELIGQSCGERPTVVIISACFSGVFVPILAAPNRMIFTAARPDRSSFGCSESDRYPYFDGCVLQALPAARDFTALAPEVKACVSKREAETGASPPSDPQLYVGAALRPILPLMTFAPG
ncbi:MAG TPA: C13 family peptidase [Caulobacteraceae bacterium]|nr:C13 family peptidase [Caulobacteraceae bacterium]